MTTDAILSSILVLTVFALIGPHTLPRSNGRSALLSLLTLLTPGGERCLKALRQGEIRHNHKM